MQPFSYHRPDSLAAALKLLGEHPDASLLAGGMTLLPTMKMRLAMPDIVIDLGAVAELRGISANSDELRIGAMSTHAEVAAHPDVIENVPALAKLAGAIGDPQVRNCGTMGGSVANSDPAADYPAAVLALAATIETDRREIAADEFFIGMFETALAEGEVVKAIRFPRTSRAVYRKFPNPASRYAVVGVMIAEVSGTLRVAVTGAASCVFRLHELEAALAKRFEPDVVDDLEIDAGHFNSDMHASQAYRAQLLKVLSREAITELTG